MSKSERTREQIRQALLFFLSQKSIVNIKVKELTEFIGIGRSTFYQYYDSVYDVLQEMEEGFLLGFREINRLFLDFPLDNRYFAVPHPIIIETLEHLKKSQKLVTVLFGPNGDALFQSKCVQLIRDFILEKAAMEKGVDMKNDIVAAYFVGGLRDMTIFWLTHDTGLSNEEFAMLWYRMAFGVSLPQ